MARRRCSECSEALPHDARSNQITCAKDKCRKARSRRLARANQRKGRGQNVVPDALVDIKEATTGQVQSAIHDVAVAELGPVVREAITDDVLVAIRRLVNLTPSMVDAIEADLTSLDANIRQRAYTLLARYTLGNPSVAPAPADVAPAPMQVVFNMPRPDGDAPVAAEAEELRTCVECSNERPTTEFVGSSDRCTTCHAQLQTKVAERFG